MKTQTYIDILLWIYNICFTGIDDKQKATQTTTTTNYAITKPLKAPQLQQATLQQWKQRRQQRQQQQLNNLYFSIDFCV